MMWKSVVRKGVLNIGNVENGTEVRLDSWLDRWLVLRVEL